MYGREQFDQEQLALLAETLDERINAGGLTRAKAAALDELANHVVSLRECGEGDEDEDKCAVRLRANFRLCAPPATIAPIFERSKI